MTTEKSMTTERSLTADDSSTTVNGWNRNGTTLTIALAATLKLILQTYHVSIITDAQLNDIVNGVAAAATVFGVYMTHLKRRQNQKQSAT